MPIASQQATLIAGIPPGGIVDSTIASSSVTVDKTTALNDTFKFVAGWILLITILMFANRTRLGHVIIYYTLILMILLILVTEYAQIAPMISGIQTIGQLTNKISNATSGAKTVSDQTNNFAH
jgi:hypothetical protein